MSAPFQARVHPTSRSTAAHILQHSAGCVAAPTLDPQSRKCALLLRAPGHPAAHCPRTIRVSLPGLEAPSCCCFFPKASAAALWNPAAPSAARCPLRRSLLWRSGFVLFASCKVVAALPQEESDLRGVPEDTPRRVWFLLAAHVPLPGTLSPGWWWPGAGLPSRGACSA